MKSVYFSPAKINLSLLVYPLNKQNYHNIYSIFQKVSLVDELIFSSEKSTKPRLLITGEGIDFPTNETNILFKVFNFYKEYINTDINVHIKKQIPLGSGMGGSSSNAATFIMFLSANFEEIKKQLDLSDIAIKIGADVPFFLKNTTALVEGIGEKITPLPTKEINYYILINPNSHCETKKVYKSFDALKLIEPTEEEKKQVLNNYVGENMLMKATLNSYDEVKDFYNSFKSIFNYNLHMTGSGATFFVPFPNKTDSEAALVKIINAFPKYYVKAVQTYVEK